MNKDDSPNYITPEGLKALQDEARALMHDERPKMVEVVAWAASNGDRSENGDYLYGKKRLREIDRRLSYLGGRIDGARVVDPKDLRGDKVVFGSTVLIENEDGEQFKYKLVGEDEFEIAAHKISWKSPLAKALMGKMVGDEVMVKKPKGDEFVTILKILFI